ncbi:MAG TPA: hypothetical protein VIU46_12285 [Gallionellaceae bacterium]
MKDSFSDSVFTMLQLQRALNDRADRDWFAKQPLFLRAATLAATAATVHYGWDLWKNSEPNLPEVRHTMDQILGHLLAHSMARKGRRDEELYRIVKEIEAIYTSVQRKDAHFGMDFLAKIDLLASRCAQLDDAVAWAIFFSAIVDVGYEWETLCHNYFSDNVLKLFRLDYGQDSETYSKAWGAKQDYVHLKEIISESEKLDLAAIRHALVMRYSVLTGRRSTDETEPRKQ